MGYHLNVCWQGKFDMQDSSSGSQITFWLLFSAMVLLLPLAFVLKQAPPWHNNVWWRKVYYEAHLKENSDHSIALAFLSCDA